MSVSGPLGVSSGAIGLKRRLPRTSLAATRELVGLLALAALLISCALISLSAAGTDALLPESIRPVPQWLTGPFGATGIDIGGLGVAAVMVMMFASYVVAVHLAERLSGRAVLTTIAALNALVLLAPPLLSTDIFSYQAYARMFATYHANPYLHGPSTIALDPLYPYVSAKWVGTPTAYGPAFTLLSALMAHVSVATSVISFKAIAALSSLGTVALLWHSARLRGLNPVRTVALFGLNPLVVVYGVGGGHNDLLMLFALAAGLWAILARKAGTGGAMIALAIGVKVTAGVFLPFALLEGRGASAVRRRRDLLIGFAVGVVLIGIGSAIAFGTGPFRLPLTLHQTQSAGDWHSIAGFITSSLHMTTLGHAAGIVLGLAFVTITGWLARRVWLGRMDWIDGAAWATLALLVAASSLLPWYVSWLIPLAGLASDRRVWRWSLVFSGFVLLLQVASYV